MGKTPKKAVPGGDERNLYIRRLKTATASSKASDTSLPERQRESENENRSKLSGTQKQLPSNTGKTFKSKLRSPSKSGVSRLPKPQSRVAAASSKEHKKLEPAYKAAKSMMSKLQKEAEEADVKLKVSIEKEDVKEQNPENETKEQITDKEAESETQTNEKLEDQHGSIDSVESNQSDAIILAEKVVTPQNIEDTSKPEEIITDEKNNHSTTTEEDQEGSNFRLNFIIEDDSPKKSEDNFAERNSSQEEEQVIEIKNDEKEMKASITEKDDNKSEALTDTESYSVDVVESTTSEVSEASELVTQIESDKVAEKSTSIPGDDVSFVTYDSNIMLKDVKIKLNDCLKDNSKLFDTSNADNSISEPLSKDSSFGRTLRNISGRHSIGRMRHVTLRDRRLSPNNSLFVNTSSASLPAEEAGEQKFSHYRSDLSEKFSSNGSAMEKKRKLELDACNSAKKIKTNEESSFLNSSIGLLRGWRRPIQVSTPNVAGYKLKPDKLNISGIHGRNDRILDNESEVTKNWCTVM
ncbi:pre-mRNA-splicing factor CWC22 homolog [Cephus cinctus]|uniref:Pre-mRNA-splicing factor CWC22 homolog n=1 Tax=Cephus cinctus TaxID=211228 RepID=A0AAJ7BUR0_CEPCN|nr:pre-mRNA-splicing factor CWC22 homolog [Cephus cinctus]XP_015594910.1 pre-mRNA-splicing factor CWC22 homolog [Cephus cinctus]XP_015594911.1 pre-mRNA-splicing factor CWC22 homolog [Cephus cinctus]XP_015594913.1 pre-mRNA-splicing factor CWC22 homolog [Cephus cinctus]XP_015594914.1 pre-mRNA-splicing factor CWC22 homolog [Cephus cinctus]XP_015594916.1 pre-mRNA-splicing factor CWC22 homolog [Cephus cinctus]XP_015594918.1 pre-mRNA-splicing factor CWC22 homolog [Cephus cinctus]XP_024940616.1 pre